MSDQDHIAAPRVWGKAGQRLTPAEVERRGRLHRAKAAEWETLRTRRTAEARRNWAAGKVAPWRITHALGDLEGPEVDRACGVEEPTVDHWELGIVYPTWAQLEALAAITGYPVAFFCLDDSPILAAETSLRFHLPAAHISDTDAQAARRFLPEAIARTLTAEGVLS